MSKELISMSLKAYNFNIALAKKQVLEEQPFLLIQKALAETEQHLTNARVHLEQSGKYNWNSDFFDCETEIQNAVKVIHRIEAKLKEVSNNNLLLKPTKLVEGVGKPFGVKTFRERDSNVMY